MTEQSPREYPEKPWGEGASKIKEAKILELTPPDNDGRTEFIIKPSTTGADVRATLRYLCPNNERLFSTCRPLVKYWLTSMGGKDEYEPVTLTLDEPDNLPDRGITALKVIRIGKEASVEALETALAGLYGTRNAVIEGDIMGKILSKLIDEHPSARPLTVAATDYNEFAHQPSDADIAEEIRGFGG